MTLRAADAMLTRPKVLPADARVDEVRAFLARSSKVHVALLVEADGRLAAVVGRDDLAGADGTASARELGAVVGRTVPAYADAEQVRRRLGAAGRRRVAVVADDGTLLGLMCLKRSGEGFCTDAGVADRQAAREAEQVRSAQSRPR